MSLSLANVALIRSAAQLATGVAGRVSQAIGFDEILHRSAVESAGEDSLDPAVSATQLKRSLSDAVRQELAKRSIDLNQTLEMRVHEGGSIRVEGSHPRAAEIEAMFNSDPMLGQLARQLAEHAGSAAISIDLTSSGVPGNMVGPGGYPNW